MIVLALLGVGFFTRLGFWQLNRAHEKDVLFAAFQAAQSGAQLDLGQAITALERSAFVGTQVSGELVPGKTLLLDNQSHDGHYGVSVFQLLRTMEDQYLLISLGFLPAKRDRTAFPQPSVMAGPLQLRGLLSKPPVGGIRLAADLEPQSNASLFMQSKFDLTQAQVFFNVGPILPWALLLNEQDSGLVTPETYARSWIPATFAPERHRGYALTWFGLAATVVIVFLLLHRSPKPTS